MKTSIPTLLIAGITLALSASSIRAADDARDQLENRINKVDRTVERTGRTTAALERVSTETGVPLDRIRTMHKEHPAIGVGGLMVANVLADETKKSPESFMQEHVKGKKWADIAREYKVPLSKLSDRLSRLEEQLPRDNGKRK